MSSKIKSLRERRYRTDSGEFRETLEVKREIANAAGDRIPDEVWTALQQAGASAVERMRDMLDPHAFAKLKDSDKVKLLSLSLDRAYGKADAGMKRSVKVTLSADGADAVAASLARLNAATVLPEYRQTSTPHQPESPPTGETTSK